MKFTSRRLFGFILVLIGFSLAAAAWWAMHGNHMFIGRYLQASNGTHIIIGGQNRPVVLRDRFVSDSMFEGLEDGDRVLVVCDGINESYPAQSSAYFCMRLERGNATDLPDDTLRQLTELGWLSFAPL